MSSNFQRFLSGPSGVEDEYRFVNGGDMGVSDATTKLSRIAASLNPHFAIIGGDIAYANAMETCYRRWDEWFDAWEQNMVTTEGNYVPMITAIGNHESGGHMPYIDPASIPFYFRYFALANSEGQDIAEASGFSTKGLAYKAYYIGENTMFVGLDSDMATRVAGEQTEWLEDTLQDFWNTHHQSAREASNYTVRAMAFYHQPMWPSDKESGGITGMLQDNWGSVFAKYNVSVALEHHSHRYGRTVMRDKQVGPSSHRSPHSSLLPAEGRKWDTAHRGRRLGSATSEQQLPVTAGGLSLRDALVHGQGGLPAAHPPRTYAAAFRKGGGHRHRRQDVRHGREDALSRGVNV